MRRPSSIQVHHLNNQTHLYDLHVHIQKLTEGYLALRDEVLALRARVDVLSVPCPSPVLEPKGSIEAPATRTKVRAV
jgi:hypothetical protein